MPDNKSQPSSGPNISIAEYLEVMSLSRDDTLRQINLSLQAIVKNDGIIISQTSLKDLAEKERQNDELAERRKQSEENRRRGAYSRSNDDRAENRRSTNYTRGAAEDLFDKKKRKKVFDSITDAFEDTVTKAIFGTSDPIKGVLEKSVNSLAAKLNTSVSNLGDEVGKRLGNLALNSLQSSGFGRQLISEWQGLAGNLKGAVGGLFNKVGDILNSPEATNGPIKVNIPGSENNNQPNPEEFNEVPYDDIVTGNINNVREDMETRFRDLYQEMNDRFNELFQRMDRRAEQSQQAESTSDILDRNASQPRSAGNEPEVNIPNQVLSRGEPNVNIPSEELPNVNDIAEIVDSFPNPSNISDATEIIDMVEGSTEGVVDTIVNFGASAEQAGAATQATGTALQVLGAEGTTTGTALATMGANAGAAGTSLVSAAGGAASGLAGLTAAFPIATVALIGAVILIDKLSEVVGPLVEDFKDMGKKIGAAANRQYSANAKNLELYQERVKKNFTSMVTAAFDVLKEAVNKVEQTWDSILTTVSATQGYDKAGVQDLWSSYAQRLSEEGLSSVVSSADIMDKLQSVLQSGLQGAVAEEFAYQATLLNSAVPTEDFFQYASTYASIAANAIKNGADQTEAIQIANEELNSFASNLLYASRNIAGGFTTSLTNASSLFEQSAKIALTSRKGDVSEISGVLTSVSAIVGAIAPDLAGSVVDAVVSAATGGNSSELTALRAMAGTGASNTAFLTALSRDPQAVFETLFRNLANLQGTSAENYMEVAEGLSQVFGLSMDAFARVDFGYLADAISAMEVNNTSLAENMAMLASGQTTSTESQLRMQKINEYMVEQGLAYVLDNEVARSIQEHMWDEQLAREIQENTYSVDLVGSAMKLFQSIFTTIQKIVDLVNPISWFKKATNVALTAIEYAQENKDISNVIKAGVVGSGNASSFYNLTHGKQNLNLIQSYEELVGLTDKSGRITDAIHDFNSSTSYIANALNNFREGTRGLLESVSGITSKSATAQRAGKSAANSYYTNSIVSKSSASTISSGDWRTNSEYNPVWSDKEDTGAKTQEDAKKLSEQINKSITTYIDKSTSETSLLDSIKSFLGIKSKESGFEETSDHRSFLTQSELEKKVSEETSKTTDGIKGTFADWKESFEKELKLSADQSLEEVLADYGADISSIERIFDQQETAKSSSATKARELHEVQFWEDMQNFATKDFPEYLKEWESYYIRHDAYTAATKEAYKEAVELKDQQSIEQGDAILALATALTQNANWQETLGDAIKDPVVQTNALLAKILLVTEAIMQQNNETSVVSVPTSLSALGLGFSST